MSEVFSAALLKGSVVVVTGGGTGIGLATAKLAAKLGAKVAVCGRREEPLKKACETLKDLGYDSYYKTCDIRKEDTVKQFVASVLSHYGRIDVLVNNAGGQFVILAEHLSVKGFDAVVRNNLLGTWVMTREVATQAFIPQKKGRIVNIIAQIKQGFPGMVHTGAARAGVENVTKTLSREWSRFNIAVNAIAPGVIDSGALGKYPEPFLASSRKAILGGKFGTSDDIANLAVYLSSWKAAKFITGQTYYVDGGASVYGGDISFMFSKM